MAQVRCAVIALTLNRASKKTMRGRIALESTSREMHRTSVVFRPAARRTFGVCTRPRVAFDGSEVVEIAAF
jgi:hypothetical protein